MILPTILTTIFITLALIHFNWVIGGQFGLHASLPTNENGEIMLKPKKYDSAIVGLGLTAFALFYSLKAGLLNFTLPEWVFTYGGWIIPIIFLIRAIGEFKYVGFFKKVKQTQFAKADTKLFSPLCLFIAVSGVIIQLS
ncbi:DUF3995 domain-containing protein [Tamlana haliotis]|uniref:DUF3995 domain-containing protein n=1 Tax=Pseudotamlana haliotis TaxID=2614804 RepID=A0A6N6MF17_9FLAO|nr:DUF3995 domain-containing protein [Tamlana haliotis]KAB1066489.1 DUF3995 domain-containing protein [Tamlana haliotis]